MSRPITHIQDVKYFHYVLGLDFRPDSLHSTFQFFFIYWFPNHWCFLIFFLVLILAIIIIFAQHFSIRLSNFIFQNQKQMGLIISGVFFWLRKDGTGMKRPSELSENDS